MFPVDKLVDAVTALANEVKTLREELVKSTQEMKSLKAMVSELIDHLEREVVEDGESNKSNYS